MSSLHPFQPETIDSNSQNPLSTSQETHLVGFIIVNIVGLKYYTGTISGRELVGLVREPFNVYDENAIKVVNTRGHQVGHIERGAAKVLAPLIDAGLIHVEGIVPNSKGFGGYKVPVQVHVFAEIGVFGEVHGAILGGGLVLVSSDVASFGMSDAVVVKERMVGGGGMSVDEVFKVVDENVGRKEGGVSKLDPPEGVVTTKLYDHQREGVGWLVERENSEELPPFWEERDGEFVNVLTNFRTSLRPEPIRGGIFADDMGLGKTLCLLSLIAFDKFFCVDGGSRVDIDNVFDCEGSSGKKAEKGRKGKRVDVDVDFDVDFDVDVEDLGGEKAKRGRKGKRVDVDVDFVVDDDDSGGKKAKRGRKGKRVESSNASKNKRRKVGGSNVGSQVSGNVDTNATLVVCTPSVLSVWIDQLCVHTRKNSLKLYLYHGADRTEDIEELRKYDIVLTSYSILGVEEGDSGSPINRMNWRRIILDEAHFIRNAGAKQSRAVTALNGSRRWVVTGTPIQNSSGDLYSLMAFLKFDPFSNKTYWNSLVQRPLAQGDKKGLERLQILMATVSLRRTKAQTLSGLPTKSIQTCHVELLDEERQVYDRMEEEAKQVVRKYIDDGSVTRNYSTVLSIILRLRQICIDVALCPHDIKSLLPPDNVRDVSVNPELLEKLVSLLQDTEDFDCPICISPPTDVVITCCAHIFCRACIIKTLKRSNPSCPMCRHPLLESDIYSAPPDKANEASTSTSTSTSSKLSSKVSALLKFIKENRGVKSVVFSQFRKMLLLLEEPFKASGIRTLRLDGTMSANKRAQVIKDFGSSPSDSPTVLLASLKASGTGINLTAASVVYLLEPWWNPATEEQAMDRVHRIGQKNDVKIVRMIARDTIEERVLKLQEKKTELAQGAFRRKGVKDKDSVEDLCGLISLSS